MVRRSKSPSPQPSPGVPGEGARSLILHRVAVAVAVGILTLLTGCSRSPSTSTTPPTAIAPTIASLAPAATDLIVAIGAADHLVAISSYDPPRPQLENLPRAGDYQTTDWETLSAVRPSVLIVQMEEGRIPPGMRDHAAALGASILNIHIENLADIFTTIDQLGSATKTAALSTEAARQIHATLDSVQKSAEIQQRIPAMICLSESGTFAAGPGTYLDDLLTLAGGTNVLHDRPQHWPTIDREQLVALSPRVVISLLPGATPQVIQKSADFWRSMPGDWSNRVTTITDSWALVPGAEVGELAKRMAAALHSPGVGS